VQADAFYLQVFNKTAEQFNHDQECQDIGHGMGQIEFKQILLEQNVQGVQNLQESRHEDENDIDDEHVDDIPYHYME
jgi:hypothetical protein